MKENLNEINNKNAVEDLKRAHVGKSIIFTLINLISISIVYLLFMVIYIVLSIIPVIGSFIKIIFIARGESSSILIPLLSIVVAYFCSNWLMERIHDDIPTLKLTRKITGIIICILNSIILIWNISLASNALMIYINILFIIFGIFLFLKKDF